MPIIFLDNYPKNNLESSIVKKDKSPLEGEIWVYKQFLQFNDNNFVPNDNWYLKHNYSLSTHPACKNKIEGQIDFLLLTKFGLLVIEVKGGGLRVDDNDCYYSYNRFGEYETQNPFNQARDYVHSLKQLNDSANLFVYRAIILPHEVGFELKGPQLAGYRDFFFSKRSYASLESDLAINKLFFNFISDLPIKTRKHYIHELYPLWNFDKINQKTLDFYPLLSVKDIKRIKSELFPIQNSYGYNPERIKSELILNENYEIFKGLRRNPKILIQGAPGTGKTTLAQKFLAENLLKQHRGVFFCSNKLIRSKLEYVVLNEYHINPDYIEFKIYSESTKLDYYGRDIDFFIFDEAQEYFSKGLFDFIERIKKTYENPRIIILYDPEQSIISNFTELAWYTDFFVSVGFVHFCFDKVYRCIQNNDIINISNLLIENQFSKIPLQYSNYIVKCDNIISQLKILKAIIDEMKFLSKEKILLINTHIFDNVIEVISDYYKNYFEELTETNINIQSHKIRYTTPFKYRGVENKCIYLVTDIFNDKNRVQNYVGVTRAMEVLKIIIWN